MIGRELTATGFNLNFAPVLDLNLNSENQPSDAGDLSEPGKGVNSGARSRPARQRDYRPGNISGFGDTVAKSASALPVSNVLDDLGNADIAVSCADTESTAP